MSRQRRLVCLTDTTIAEYALDDVGCDRHTTSFIHHPLRRCARRDGNHCGLSKIRRSRRCVTTPLQSCQRPGPTLSAVCQNDLCEVKENRPEKVEDVELWQSEYVDQDRKVLAGICFASTEDIPVSVIWSKFGRNDI